MDKLFCFFNNYFNNFQIGGLLIELTDLDQEHVQLQIATIKWYRSMQEVFDQNASLFENFKSQFEEHLQNVTKKLNEDIDNLIPNISVINDMTDPDKLKDYQVLLKSYIGKLKCFKDYVLWINKEEKLFKMTATKYDVLDELTSYVEPFSALVG